MLLFVDALDEPSSKSREQKGKDDFYATSLEYLAEQFENHAIDITKRLQQLNQSSDDFVSSDGVGLGVVIRVGRVLMT